MSPLEIAALFTVVTVAACLQGAIGFGMALISAPLLVLIEPALVPGPLIASSLVLVSLTALRDRAHADLRTVRFSMMGNVVGAFCGASVVAILDPRGFSVLFGLLVLLGVGLSAAGLRVALSRGAALGAGLLGGFMSATSAIGGPPMALIYQHEGADRFRGTLAVYFIVSCSMSLIALGWFGEFGLEELSLSLYLIPAQITGFLLSFALGPVLAGASIRPFILGLSALAGLGVLVRVVMT